MRESSHPTGFVFTGHCKDDSSPITQKRRLEKVTYIDPKNLDFKMESKGKRVKFSSDIEVQPAADYNREMKSRVSKHVSFLIQFIEAKEEIYVSNHKRKTRNLPTDKCFQAERNVRSSRQYHQLAYPQNISFLSKIPFSTFNLLNKRLFEFVQFKSKSNTLIEF